MPSTFPSRATAAGYQSEAELEKQFIALLESQAYERLSITSEADLIANLRSQLEALNQVTFSDAEWERFFNERIAGKNDGIVEKTVRVQEDHVQLLTRDDGSTKNISLLDKQNIHNNRLQVLNQYEVAKGGEAGGKFANRYDVTVLVNGLPMVHIELKRRGVDIREAFNQINRYQRDSFWAGSGLFEYVQLFVISNGTLTKYYSNTTRTPAPQRGGERQEARQADLELVRVHLMVGGRDEQADPRPDRVRQDVLRQAHHPQHPDALLRADERPDAARDAPVPDRGDRADPAEDRRLRPTTRRSAQSPPAATSGTPPAPARR